MMLLPSLVITSRQRRHSRHYRQRGGVRDGLHLCFVCRGISLVPGARHLRLCRKSNMDALDGLGLRIRLRLGHGRHGQFGLLLGLLVRTILGRHALCSLFGLCTRYLRRRCRLGSGGMGRTTGNVYSHWGPTSAVSRTSAGYNAWTGNAWSSKVGASYNSVTGRASAGQRAAVSNVYTGNYAYGQRGATYNPNTGVSARGGSATYGNAYTGQQGTAKWGQVTGPGGQTAGAAKVNNNIYADHNGNIYKDTGSGWEKYDNGSWNSVQDSKTAQSLNSQQWSRQAGDQRSASSSWGSRSWGSGESFGSGSRNWSGSVGWDHSNGGGLGGWDRDSGGGFGRLGGAGRTWGGGSFGGFGGGGHSWGGGGFGGFRGGGGFRR
jgi:hypothetical protein